MKKQVFIHKNVGALIVRLSNTVLYCGYFFNHPNQTFYSYYNFFKFDQFNINDINWINLDD